MLNQSKGAWLAVVVLACMAPKSLLAETPVPAPTASPQRVDPQKLTRAYLSQGDSADVQVVQQRLYSKSGRLEIGIFGGNVGGDPFLSERILGAHLGFHFNETFSLSVLGWKDSVNPSSAADSFEKANGFVVNTNIPKSFLGAELGITPIYGKLSLFNRMILHFDTHFVGGVGTRSSESGTSIAPFLGIGQQLFLNRYLSLRIDYRLLYFKEDIPEKANSALGPTADTRRAFAGAFTLGFSAFL